MEITLTTTTFRNQLEQALDDSLEPHEKGMLKETFHLGASRPVEESTVLTIEELTKKFQDTSFSEALRKLRRQ